MLVAVTIFTLGNSTDAFLLLRFSDLGVGAGWLAVLWAAHNLVRMASTWVGGRPHRHRLPNSVDADYDRLKQLLESD